MIEASTRQVERFHEGKDIPSWSLADGTPIVHGNDRYKAVFLQFLMSKNHTSSPNPAAKRVLTIAVVLLIVISGIYLIKTTGRDKEAAPIEPVESTESPVLEETPQPEAMFETLIGRWLREDGGYVVEISGVLPDGTLKAAYFNPRPIHVSQAAAAEEGGNVKVGIELNDVNYPGCLYTLVLDPVLDQLHGTYFQAAMGETFKVTFVRMPID